MIQSLSVIVPVLNKENEILQTLTSVEASIQYFYRHYQGNQVVEAEIIVVNEGSSDRTPEIIHAFSKQYPHCHVINHHRRVSAGAARNTGVKIAKGDLLFFCDGDDLYFPEHIYTCFQLINHDPDNHAQTCFTVETSQGVKTVLLPTQPIGVVRTGVYMKDEVDPFWRTAIENSIPQNLCVRRDCHEFVEGFPEERIPYNQITCEDISYGIWLGKFFKQLKVNLETVEYIRYPGNMFDRQLQKFQTSPENYQEEMTSDQQELHLLRHKIEQERIAYLLEKLKRIEKTPALLSVLNWLQLGTDYLNQNLFQDALPFLEYGVSVEPENTVAKNLLAAAYNNVGSAIRTQGELEKATSYYKQSLAMNPTFSPPDLARVHFNLATILKDQQEYEQALVYLQKTLELEPNLAEAIAELPKFRYHAHVAHQGYQFSQDWFSINLPVWLQYLMEFINQPDLKVLEIGSWEGRSTCWLLDNVLTHDSAQITCIDTFSGSVEHAAMGAEATVKTIEQQFDLNIQRTGHPEKVHKLIGTSQTVLRSLLPNRYHLAYIDGSHVASDVLEDALLTWRLVKVGGVIIFDDYGFMFPQGIEADPPKIAIDAFLNVFKTKITLLYQGYQVLIEKIAE